MVKRFLLLAVLAALLLSACMPYDREYHVVPKGTVGGYEAVVVEAQWNTYRSDDGGSYYLLLKLVDTDRVVWVNVDVDTYASLKLKKDATVLVLPGK